MAVIFLNYRREDSGGYAGRIAERLQKRFGEDNVFRDIDSLRGGLPFEDDRRRLGHRASLDLRRPCVSCPTNE